MKKPAKELRALGKPKRPRAARKVRAAKPARAGRAAATRDRADSLRLLHELQVHEVELELQNEELRTTRGDLEIALARYQELFEHAPIGYAALGPDGAIRELNRAGAQILGASRGRLIGRVFASVVAESHVAEYTRFEEAARTAVHPSRLEVVVRDRALQLTATRLTAGGADLLVAFDDITARKREAEQLAASERALRERDRRKDEFLAALSHELRDPLAPIVTSLFVLGHAEGGSEAARSAHAIIDEQVRHLTRLVEDLLDVARVSQGKIKLRREPVELAGLVRRTLDAHRAACVQLGLALDSSLGPAVWIDADPARLVQVVTNLLGNALKFTPRGGRVGIEILAERGAAVLRVRDTGMGIAPDVLPHVFEPFAQVPQPIDRDRGGLGLGLAMVKALVELHRGEVEVASAGPGAGTEITVRLPLCAAPGIAADCPMPRALELPLVSRRRVLVIEDNQLSAASLREALALIGHEARIAHDGAEGLRVARAFRPEIVLCDLGLPELDGYAVARGFRSEPALRGAFLVALSGYAQPEDVKRARSAGFDRHLPKPADIDALIRVIAEAPAAEVSRAS